MIGAVIKDYLVEKGIKQAFLVEKTGLSSHTISDICTKDRRVDCIEYKKICDALGLPLDFFYERMGNE